MSVRIYSEGKVKVITHLLNLTNLLVINCGPVASRRDVTCRAAPRPPPASAATIYHVPIPTLTTVTHIAHAHT